MALDLNVLSVIEDAVREIAPWGTGVAVTDPRLGTPESEIFYSEAVAMARAVPKRRNEFFAGRAAAHDAMVRAKLPVGPVPMGKDRAPEWPTGVVGSISHCDTACIAVVGNSERYRSLAVDVEPDEPLPEEVEPMVCLPRERAWLDRQPDAQRGRMARLIFSAKECAYKLQYPVTKKVLDFSDVEVIPDVDNRRFALRVEAGCNPFGTDQVLHGRFGTEADVMFCMMYAAQNIGNKR